MRLTEVSPNVRQIPPDSPGPSSNESPLMPVTGEIARAKRRELRRGLRRSDTAIGDRLMARDRTPATSR